MSASQLAAAVALLEELATYPDGWDGEGSFGMNEQVHQWGKQVLVLLDGQHAPEVTLNENGTVTFEWNQEGLYIYLEVGATRYALMLRRNDASEMVNGQNPELTGIVQNLILRALRKEGEA